MTRAKSYEEIKPLNELCKAGKLFEVQEWITAGKLVNPPQEEVGAHKKCPLEVAIESGFHSLVQVLLEGGALLADDRYDAMDHALQRRRFDIVELLIEHSYDIKSVDMLSVFEAWDPKVMEYFIERGADVETGYPVAWAFIHRIKTVLGIYKRYKDQFPTFQEQANIALRHHCRDGNLKWVSLMLWAGADPYAKGPPDPNEESDPEGDICALEYAALYDHAELFKLKQVRLNPNHSGNIGVLRTACHASNADILIELLDRGLDPNTRGKDGSTLIQHVLNGLGYVYDYDSLTDIKRKYIDNMKTREKIKMVHVLAQRGVTWSPRGKSDIAEGRRSLLRLTPEYTVEFIWIMSKYQACRREEVEELIRTPAMKALISGHMERVKEMIDGLDF